MDKQYWKQYFDAETVAQAETLRQGVYIASTGVQIHMDVYEQPDRNAPVLIFNHGGGGYCRFFVPLALALYQRGYTVIAPDQRGQGYSEGDRTDFTIGELVQNIIDVAHWVRARYTGKLFLGGASVGGGLTYKAAAAGAPADAIICHNLYNFGDPHDALAVSRFAALRHVPGLPQINKLMIGLGAALMPGLKIPFGWLGAFEYMVDERDTQFYSLWLRDPLPIRRVSLRYMWSTFATPPTIPYEQNQVPVLVINQTRDRMVSPAVTKRNYDKLGGPKQYIEIDYGHWATGLQFIGEYVEILDGYMQAQMGTT
ncbi:MAG TPA: alpha/beta fold hydrolase [Aggregatilineales bacterium]|nr:alpha/beta fold hydrolase [Aggregatilineales bacterium]